MRRIQLTAAAFVLLTVSACGGGNPVDSVSTGEPRFDGSGMVGSGNRSGTVTAAAESDSSFSRGSGMVGSGN
ncbi:MAG TPA: hypothetical protein VF263_26345 [Longimicrobiaceae bacterium]